MVSHLCRLEISKVQEYNPEGQLLLSWQVFAEQVDKFYLIQHRFELVGFYFVFVDMLKVHHDVG